MTKSTNLGIKMKIFKIEFTTGLLGERRERPQKTSTKGRSCNLCFTNNFPWKSDETKSIKWKGISEGIFKSLIF